MTILLSLTVFIGPLLVSPPDSLVWQLRTDTINELELAIFPPANPPLPLFYKIDWGDGETLNWSGPLRSPIEIYRYHRYTRTGRFAIRVMARDSLNNTSDWSRPCSVTVVPSLVKWYAPTVGAVVAAPALDQHSNVYIGDESGTLYSFSPQGELRWSFSTRGAIYAAVTITGALLFLVSQDSTLYCLDTLGNRRWSVPIGDELWTSPAVAPDGTLYLTTDTGKLISLTPKGKIRFTVQLGDECTSSPTIGPDGSVYVAADSVYSFSPKGKRRWTFATPDNSYFFPAPVLDRYGNILIGNFDGYIYSLRPDGRLGWRAPVPDEDEIRTEIVFSPEGKILLGTDGYYLCAKTESDTVKVLYEAGDILCATPAVSENGTVYFLADDGTLYALTAAGRMLMKLDIAYGDKEIYYTSSPTIGPDGTVYIGSWDGGVYALYGDAPPAATIWPQFRGDSQHTGRIAKNRNRK